MIELNKIVFSILFILIVYTSALAQTEEIKQIWVEQNPIDSIKPFKPDHLVVEKDKMLDMFNRQPNFGIYKDNYFATGFPTNKAVNSNNSDAKFQISIRQRLFKSNMPFNTQLMLVYTQKSFWNIYEKSAPFHDNNYNPGLLLIKPVIRDNKLMGVFSFSFEHESNGETEEKNRSWNYFTISGMYFFNIYFSVQVKLWYGWLDDHNHDLFKYKGYGLAALNYRNINDRIDVGLVINPSGKSVNTQLEFNYKMSTKSNQYIFIQWYNGYAEGLLEYKKYASMIRIGICLKAPLDIY